MTLRVGHNRDRATVTTFVDAPGSPCGEVPGPSQHALEVRPPLVHHPGPPARRAHAHLKGREHEATPRGIARCGSVTVSALVVCRTERDSPELPCHTMLHCLHWHYTPGPPDGRPLAGHTSPPNHGAANSAANFKFEVAPSSSRRHGGMARARQRQLAFPGGSARPGRRPRRRGPRDRAASH